MEAIDKIVALIEQVPAEFWGIVIGSVLALAGVHLSNKANLRNLREQFTHDRALRTKEREHNLRKDVYLEVADAMRAGIESIGRLSNLDLSYQDAIEPYESRGGAIAKSYVIGGDQVVSTIARLVGKIGAAMLKLAVPRYKLVEIKNRISAIEAANERSNSECSRILQQMTQLTVAGQMTPERHRVLDEVLELESNFTLERNQEREALIQSGRPQQIQFMRDCVTESHAAWEFITPALFAVRRELEMPIDEAACRTVFAASLTEMRTAIDAFTQELETAAARNTDRDDQALGEAPA